MCPPWCGPHNTQPMKACQRSTRSQTHKPDSVPNHQFQVAGTWFLVLLFTILLFYKLTGNRMKRAALPGLRSQEQKEPIGGAHSPQLQGLPLGAPHIPSAPASETAKVGQPKTMASHGAGLISHPFS